MAIRTTPVVFLLNIGAAITMLGMFVMCSAHVRLQDKMVTRTSRVDRANIYICVCITSLFLMWSIGGAIASYFGNYSVFLDEMPPAYKNLFKLEILIDILQKSLGFFILSVAAFQNAFIGDRDTLLPWGKVCIMIGVIQAFVFFIAQRFFEGVYGWIILFILSATFDCIVMLFSVLSFVLIRRDVNTKGMSGYLPKKMLAWNMRTCLFVFFAFILDFFAKSGFVVLEIKKQTDGSLPADLASVARGTSTLLLVHQAYLCRIPRTKAYSTNDN